MSATDSINQPTTPSASTSATKPGTMSAAGPAPKTNSEAAASVAPSKTESSAAATGSAAPASAASAAAPASASAPAPGPAPAAPPSKATTGDSTPQATAARSANAATTTAAATTANTTTATTNTSATSAESAPAAKDAKAPPAGLARRTSSRRAHQLRVKMVDVNQYIVCQICMGYIVNATTISECLHSFCRSCIVKHFRKSKICPVCNQQAHETAPLDTLRQDRTLQSIINKLLPDVAEAEREARRAFYGIEDEPDAKPGSTTTATTNGEPTPKRQKMDDLIDFVMQKADWSDQDAEDLGDVVSKLTELPKPFIRTSAAVTILHLKKFLAKKLALEEPDDVEILCNGEVLGREYSLEYVARTRWRDTAQLLTLQFRPRSVY
ncbi:uncharacterized protein MONBRDRAFT_27802 [Monosiga brevicollis MX1]|uniref:RING-type domain-containing protein n=1 Tax=Monosiga brevicollis TaxID=81824 RepID=A9V6D0_MONBE|nr:uncharacterized protein MONBRDRAFT_27802 [Monosiga brevicollis MX1]EDQ86974.1 predicted protein [Monosiga brevicollis MX1]|eukprot:XP_001748213.1 hypothetical protein [Monosiga brevicollis MX1]